MKHNNLPELPEIAGLHRRKPVGATEGANPDTIVSQPIANIAAVLVSAILGVVLFSGKFFSFFTELGRIGLFLINPQNHQYIRANRKK
jgi:hypothetical protein